VPVAGPEDRNLVEKVTMILNCDSGISDIPQTGHQHLILAATRSRACRDLAIRRSLSSAGRSRFARYMVLFIILWVRFLLISSDDRQVSDFSFSTYCSGTPDPRHHQISQDGEAKDAKG
jgi:hypothetical protein